MGTGAATMLFSEVYSAYYNAVAAIVSEALGGALTERRIDALVREKAFSESVLTIIPAIKNGEWAILDKDLKTPIKHMPQMPLTVIQKRWLKALSLDARIALFDVRFSGLEDVEPLFTPDDFVFFDRYTDADPYQDADYIRCFKTVLTAAREKRKLYIEYRNRHARLVRGAFIPHRLEYSAKDDKFRLETTGERGAAYINLARIVKCELREPFDASKSPAPKRHVRTVTFILTDERNALNRVLLNFSDCQKETIRLDSNKYRVVLTYEKDDETEILIRILSFGPVIQVTKPEGFITLIKKRITMQQGLIM